MPRRTKYDYQNFRDIILGAKMDLWEEIPDNEILGTEVFFLESPYDAVTYERVTNDAYYRMTGSYAKSYAAANGRLVKFYRKMDKSCQKMIESIIEDASVQAIKNEERPGSPFFETVLKDRFTIDKGEIDYFYARHARKMAVEDIIPVLQQIMTNQKEIMEILKTKPEDKMIKEKFLEEFDKTMKKVIES